MTTTLDPMTGRQFHRLIGSVLPHADTALPERADLPELTNVSCEVHAGMLYLIATDRYTLGVTRRVLPPNQPREDVSITFPAGALRKVLRSVDYRDQLTVMLDAEGFTVIGSGIAHWVPASPLPFPVNWRRFFGPKLRVTGRRAIPIGLNPAYLQRFTRATAPGLPLEFRASRTPVLVSCGAHFLGAITPVRLDEAAPLALWEAA